MARSMGTVTGWLLVRWEVTIIHHLQHLGLPVTVSLPQSYQAPYIPALWCTLPIALVDTMLFRFSFLCYTRPGSPFETPLLSSPPYTSPPPSIQSASFTTPAACSLNPRGSLVKAPAVPQPCYRGLVTSPATSLLARDSFTTMVAKFGHWGWSESHPSLVSWCSISRGIPEYLTVVEQHLWCPRVHVRGVPEYMPMFEKQLRYGRILTGGGLARPPEDPWDLLPVGAPATLGLLRIPGGCTHDPRPPEDPWDLLPVGAPATLG